MCATKQSYYLAASNPNGLWQLLVFPAFSPTPPSGILLQKPREVQQSKWGAFMWQCGQELADVQRRLETTHSLAPSTERISGILKPHACPPSLRTYFITECRRMASIMWFLSVRLASGDCGTSCGIHGNRYVGTDTVFHSSEHD